MVSAGDEVVFLTASPVAYAAPLPSTSDSSAVYILHKCWLKNLTKEQSSFVVRLVP